MKYNTVLFLLIIYLYYCFGINLYTNKLRNKKKSLATYKYKINYQERKLSFLTWHPLYNFINEEEMFIHKLKDNSITLDDFRSFKLYILKNNIYILLDYIKNQNENQQIEIIRALNDSLIRENIKFFFSLMPNMKILHNKISLIHRLVALDSHFVMKNIQDIFNFMSEEKYNSFLVYDIFIHLNFDYPDVFIQNRNQIFNLLSTASPETQWRVIEHLADRQPKEFESNIEKIINIMVKMKDSNRQLYMVILILNQSPEIIYSDMNKIYNMIEKIQNTNEQLQLLKLLSNRFPLFFLCNLNKIFGLKFNKQSIDEQKKPLELLINNIPLDILNNKEIKDNIFFQNCKQSIWKFSKSMTNPIARILIFLIKADPSIIKNNESMIEVKKITDRMDYRNYQEIIKYLPTDMFEMKPDDKECVICLEKIDSDEESNWCSENHNKNGFHYRCIREALKKSKYCPICRKILIQ